ncbi:MAG: ferritin [Dehalococcoidia bacterium]
MLSESLQQALNQRMTREFEAAQLYLAMSGYFSARSLEGFARWMRVQSEEEQTHGLRLFDLILARGGQIALGALATPEMNFTSALDVAKRGLTRERQVTADFHRIYALAAEERDFTTQIQLQWFLTEQVEEELQFSQLVDELALAGDHAATLLFLDRELGGRRASRMDQQIMQGSGTESSGQA